ncbi:hypothetical protein CSC76_05375 [Pseudoxanthomonas mexicana]|uniref:hypothetical protein n=1 Tax=Pseudoxanthomonas mexicana TaxID=128785 RepID=UPI001389F025|nr:hypothetical protein [Pseudoxanthomonas mexicana]KAF1728485.1 hypothetical protein CSC76_05375 [Pseudoxanthomonas mexicana]
MSGAWRPAAWLLAGLSLVIGGFFLPLPPGIASVSAAMIVAGGVALVLGATKVQMMIESLLQLMARSTPRAGADQSD